MLYYDCVDRIRSSLIHELCHAATWIIDGVKRAGHGPIWKAWLVNKLLINKLIIICDRGQKANSVYPQLEPISRCHSYEISYKYTYLCTTCDFKLVTTTQYIPYCVS